MRLTVHPSQFRNVFTSVKDSATFAESAALVAAGGNPVEMLQAMALRPELLKMMAATGEAIYPGGIIERSVKEMIILEASRTNACQFCTESHIAIVRMMGLNPSGENPLSLLDDLSRLSRREALAVEYTRAAQADSNRVPAELFERLRAAFSDPEIVELTAMIGLISMLNIFNNCLQVTYHGEYDQPGA